MNDIIPSERRKAIEMFKFIACMKVTYITPVYKKRSQPLKINKTLYVFFPTCQKYFKDIGINKCFHISITSFQKISVNLEITHSVPHCLLILLEK